MKSLYEILGLARTATTDEIRKAYRTLSKGAHPDTGGDAETFARLATAMKVLTNPDDRAHYDATGEEGKPVYDLQAKGLETALAAIVDAIERTLQAATTLNLKTISLASIAEQRRKAESDRQGFERRIDRLKETAKRMRLNHEHKGEEDRLGMRFNGMLDMMGRNVDAAKARIAELDKASEILAWYEWDDGGQMQAGAQGFALPKDFYEAQRATGTSA